MHLFMDKIPNLYNTFMGKHANMCKMCKYVHICVKYVLKLQFYAIALLQKHKYGRGLQPQPVDELIKQIKR